MLTTSKLALSFALMLGAASVTMAATKHPIHHQRTVVQPVGQTETSSSAGLSYDMQPSQAQRLDPEPTHDLFRDPDWIAPQGHR
jgi:hypothetical protein